MDKSDTYTRRRLLRGAASATLVTATAATAGSAAAQGDAYDGYLADDDSFGGVTRDARGRDTVQIDVGAQGNNGPNAFGPSAILIDSDTTVEWVWTGNGFHNVVDEAGAFETDVTDEEGNTFEYSFSEEGVTKYFCQPHKAVGMRGVIVVGEENVETDLAPFGAEQGAGLNTTSIWAGAAVLGGISVLGVAAYRELVDGVGSYEAADE